MLKVTAYVTISPTVAFGLIVVQRLSATRFFVKSVRMETVTSASSSSVTISPTGGVPVTLTVLVNAPVTLFTVQA